MKTIIKVEKLSKSFEIRENFPGIWGAFKGLFHAKKKKFSAIDNLCFSIDAGESIAFIGPNGAGKSTTIKMLTGILYPSGGHIEVLGLVPWKQRRHLGYQIGTVFGQRTQLWYHLPAADTFALLAKIYEIEAKAFAYRLQELTELFQIGPLLQRPVRGLSLGERMRCEIVASLLHKPKILFLDEPTIGLDVNAKLLIRSLLNRLAEDHGTTLFLTSHDTADIEQVCDRVLILDKGKLIADSPLRDLKKRTMKKKVLTLITEEQSLPLALPGIKVLENVPYHFKCEVELEKISMDQVIKTALQMTSLKDITIEDPSMDEVIRMLYNKE